MFQYDGPYVVANRPARTSLGTIGWFQDGDPLTNQPATILNSEFMDMWMAEGMTVVQGAGIPLNKAVDCQLRDAILALGYYRDTGAPNAYAIATGNALFALAVPPLSALTPGTRFQILAANTNTIAASTLTIDADAPVPWVNNAGAALAPGDIQGGSLYPVMFDGTKVRMLFLTMSQMTALVSAPVPVPIAGAAHAYAAADKSVLRSNGGAPMVDTLAGGAGALPANWSGTIVNADSAGLLAIQVGAGSTLSGPNVINGYLVLGPGQRVTITCDGTNYQAWGAPMRARCAAPTSLFVTTGGSDAANTGVATSSPFASVQHAHEWAKAALDLAGFTLTIFAPGTNNFGLVTTILIGQITGQSGPVIIAGTGFGTTNFGAIVVNSGANILVQNATLSNAAANIGACLIAQFAAAVAQIGPGIVFGASATSHIQANADGQVIIANSYSIAGNAAAHWQQANGGKIIFPGSPVVITFAVAVAFSVAFALAAGTGSISLNSAVVSFAGLVSGVTGMRFSVSAMSLINTSGAGFGFLPGSPGIVAGTNYVIATGGNYV